MSIKIKQLLLLLGIALLPVIVSGGYSLRQIELLADGIEESTRSRELERDRRYLQEKVADIGTGLQLIARATELSLQDQRRMLERALKRPAPNVNNRVLYSDAVAALPDAVEDRRFTRSASSGQSPHVKISFSAPSFLLADEDCAADQCQRSIRKLAAYSDQLRDIYEQTSNFSLWHYAGLANGVSMAYPAHGDYPVDYDPRERPWYQAAKEAGATVWLPLTIDASTGQPVLTAATPLRGERDHFIGATAIDLPLHELLNFDSSAAPRLRVARLALLRTGPGDQLEVIATQRALQAGSDWRSGQQTRSLDGLSRADMGALQALPRGGGMLLERVNIDDAEYTVALTALHGNGTSWLALASPISAIETAAADAVAGVKAEREQTLQRYLLGALLLIVAAAAVAVIFAERVTAPLIAMSRTAEDLAAGKLESRTGIQRDDEIGQLSRSIDRMADSIEQLQLDQEDAYRDMIMALHRALEKKDAYTAGHTGRVTRVALKLGNRIGLDEQTLEKLRFGALTHDLGKIGIADSVLNKPADLTEAEFEIMKQHPTFSRTIMKPLIRFEEYSEIAGSHHEHWDGGGYPDGLAGEDIHLLARIVAIADAWDSMVGDRIYRKGMGTERALAILDREKDDGQFDPKLIREFIAMIREESGTPPT